VPGTTPLEDTTQKRTDQASSNKKSAITDTPAPPSAPRAPYTSTTPVSKPAPRDDQSKNVKQKPSESHELTSRQPSKPPTNTPRTEPSSTTQAAANPNAPAGRRRPNKAPTSDDNASSQF
jgi:hypothetical protein